MENIQTILWSREAKHEHEHDALQTIPRDLWIFVDVLRRMRHRAWSKDYSGRFRVPVYRDID